MCDNRDWFCYICGLFTDSKHKIELKSNLDIITLYEQYFGRCYLIDKWYVPEICCTTCVASLRIWKYKPHGTIAMPISEPVAWLPQVHHNEADCYFCLTKTNGYYYKIRHTVKYAEVKTVVKAVLRKSEDEIPNPRINYSPSLNISQALPSTSAHESSEYVPPAEYVLKPRHFVTQEEFTALVRDLGLTKTKAEVLGSRMQQWNFLEDNVNITSLRYVPTNEFQSFFTQDTQNTNESYCNNVKSLFNALGHSHNENDWRLFIDGSTKSKNK